MSRSINDLSEKELKKIKEAVLELFLKHPNKAYNHKQVARHVKQNHAFVQSLYEQKNLSPSKYKSAIISALNNLFQDDELVETEIGKYRVVPKQAYVTGRIDITSSGAAYLMNDDYEDDIYISPKNVNNALNGDLVRIFLHARRPGKRLTGEVVEIMERFKEEFVGVVQLSKRFAFLVPDSNKMDVDIFIPLKNLNKAKHGQKAVARITDWPVDAHNPEGEIIQVLGNPGDNETEMHAILIEYGFAPEFPEQVEKETEKIPYRIAKTELKKRRDFREIPTLTIDPEDAKDFDDALSFEELEDGKHRIGIHIADVTHYVKDGTALNDEALQRATSVYLVDRVIPMLPEKISNEVCSLRPDEDKLCFSAVFTLNEKAEVIDEWFGRTIIHSDKRFTYEQAQGVIEKNKGPFVKELSTLNTLAQTMRAARFKNGAINFDSIEVKFKLDETSYPTGVYVKEHKEANKLIEEFMLLANKRVAEFIGKHAAHDKDEKQKTFVYRVHDVPVPDKLESFASFANKFGYRVVTSTDSHIAKSLNKLIIDVKGKKEQNVLEKLAIRTMSKAVYSTENIGHYGLAFDYYTHFTSPIRRYPDMMVHRLLQHYLDGGKSVNREQWEEHSRHATDLEIMATDAERASVKYMQVLYLEDKKDKVFDGIISGVQDYGIFVELTESKCEGLVRIRNLGDDFYEFDEEHYCLVGYRTKKKYQLGDSVQVIIEQTDLQKRQIDFILVEDGVAQIGSGRSKKSGGKPQKKKQYKKKSSSKKNKGKKRRY